MLNIAVCDDNALWLEKVNNYICTAFSALEADVLTHKFQSGESLLRAAADVRFDAAFLDIDMPAPNGFAIAEQLSARVAGCAVIFITGHPEYVFDSFEYRPFNFIVKPVDGGPPARMERIVAQLLRHVKQNESVSLSDDNGRMVLIPLCDVMYIESDGHHIFYYLVGKNEPVRRTDSLSAVEDRLAAKDFIRVGKSCVANIHHIIDLNRTRREITSSDGCKHVIGRRYFAAVCSVYKLYLRDSM
jgi:DNA-binding LytR/AlgR family response regulator